MQQLEIEYFFPLTEQIKLDLDFTTSEQYEKERQEKRKLTDGLIDGTFLLAGSGIGIGYATTSNFVLQNNNVEHMRIDAEGNFHIAPKPDKVGYWEVTKDFWVYTEKKPNIITRLMTKAAFGWNWKAK